MPVTEKSVIIYLYITVTSFLVDSHTQISLIPVTEADKVKIPCNFTFQHIHMCIQINEQKHQSLNIVVIHFFCHYRYAKLGAEFFYTNIVF